MDKNSLAELFARDPLELSNEDVDRIAAKLREQRAQWVLDEQKSKTKVKKATLSEKEMDDLLNNL